MHTLHNHIQLFAGLAAPDKNDLVDVRVNKFQRQILCEGLSCLSHHDTAGVAKITEARAMLLALINIERLPSHRRNGGVLLLP